MTGFIPIIFLMSVLGAQIVFCGDMRPYVPLLLATALTFAMGSFLRKKSWKELSSETFATVTKAMNALFIYLLVGPLIAAWIASGTLPFFIIQGAKLVTPRTLTAMAFVLTSLAGIPMGSGISVIGTVGVAMAGLAEIYGIPREVIAGAIAGGAYLGNVISPAAPCTNVAAPVVNGEIKDHVTLSMKRMALPFACSVALYLALGMSYSAGQTETPELLVTLEQFSHPDWLCALPMIVLFVMIFRGSPALVAFFCSIMTSVLIGLFEGRLGLTQVSALLVNGYRYTGTDARMALMLNRGGFNSMMSLVLTLFMALAFGGSMKASGLITEAMNVLGRFVKSAWSLRCTAALAVLMTGAFLGSANLAIVLVGSLLAPLCERFHLSRTELGVILSNVSITSAGILPWTACGAGVFSLLGLPMDVSGMAYIPYALCCYMTTLWLILVPLRRNTCAK